MTAGFRMAFRISSGGNEEFFAGGNTLDQIASVYFVKLFAAIFRWIAPQSQDIFQVSAGNFVQNLFDFFVTAADAGQVCQGFGTQFIFNMLRKFKRFTVGGAACTVSHADKIRF